MQCTVVDLHAASARTLVRSSCPLIEHVRGRTHSCRLRSCTKPQPQAWRRPLETILPQDAFCGHALQPALAGAQTGDCSRPGSAQQVCFAVVQALLF